MTTTHPIDAARSAALLDRCEALVALATKKGATGCEVYAEHAVQTGVSLEQSDLKGISVEEHQAVGVRVLLGDRLGFAYVNRMDDQAIDDAIDDALAIARAAPGDDANGFVEPEPLSPVDGLWDDDLATIGPEAAATYAGEMLSAALSVDDRVSVDSGSFSNTLFAAAVASSTGVAAHSRGSAASLGLFGMAIDGDEVGSFDHVYEGVRARAALDPAPLGRRFGDAVVSLLGPRAGRSYKGKVLFSPDAFEEIFVDVLLSATDGDSVTKGRSRFKDKLGETVAVSGLTLIDDGTLPGALASDVHDREGLPHRRTPLLDGGVLRTFLYDGKAARRAGVRPTGHAQGSARSAPSCGTTNLVVAEGPDPEAALFSGLGSGLLVGRFSGNCDPISGDFSGVAKGSFLVEGGQKVAPVKETLIAGNVFDLLHKVVGIGDTLHTRMSTRLPYVLVDDVDVTAGAAP